MELKITKEKVLEAASKCSTAETVLKTMFPDVFEDDSPFIRNDGTWSNRNAAVINSKKDRFIIIIDGKEFILSPYYDWRIQEGNPVYSDGSKEIRLIPTLK